MKKGSLATLAVVFLTAMLVFCSVAYARDNRRGGGGDRSGHQSSRPQRTERAHSNATPANDTNRSNRDFGSVQRNRNENRPNIFGSRRQESGRLPENGGLRQRVENGRRQDRPSHSLSTFGNYDRNRSNSPFANRRHEESRTNNPSPSLRYRQENRSPERGRIYGNQSDSRRLDRSDTRYRERGRSDRIVAFGRRPVEFRHDEYRRRGIDFYIDRHHYGRRGSFGYYRYRTSDAFIFLAAVAILAAEDRGLTPDDIARNHKTYFMYRNDALVAFRADYADEYYVYHDGDPWPEWIPTYTYCDEIQVRLRWNPELSCFGFPDLHDQETFVQYYWWEDQIMADRLMNFHYYRWRNR